MTELNYFPWVLADRFADAPALRDERTELTFAELDLRVAAVSTQFAAEGIGAGDVVAVMLPNRVELVISMFAAWRLGAAVTPVNPAFTAVEADHQITDAGAGLLVTGGEEPRPGIPTIPVADLATEPVGAVGDPAPVAPADLALLVYTSGSTGRPKGVMITHANTEAMTATIGQAVELDSIDHCLLVLPLFHVNAIMVSLLATLRVGGQLSILGSFSASTFLDAVERLRPTFFSAVPTIYALLVTKVEERDPDLSSLRFAVCGAAPATQELLAACEKALGVPILEGYGLTEATCASALNPLHGPRKAGTVGPALPGQRLRIVDAELRDVSTGHSGEVLISGATVMAGYLGQPETTAQTIVDGWLRTGDVGRLDPDGYLTLVDRIKDMIIRGGENLYPKEIENAIGSLPDVLEVAVVGQPDPVLGEVPVAFVVPYPEANLTAEEVKEHCASHVTRVKVPAEVTILAEMPKNPVGKIDKPTLRRTVSSA
ncbi:class I adenylate-forming enzyme family protein [Aeromicrobium sp. CTD01-1L150]|uniref:class I adenylate-forming enzyme family protein n=1 Tax=Aeromicrobium sp. CTD01-1L150 TaxID=3341830 RepID=UPI0035C21A8B